MRVLSLPVLNRALVLCLLTVLSPVANSIEEPQFELVSQIGAIEIRRYSPTIQAVTPMPDYSSGGFRRLAGYIFGGNDGDQSIAMTAPVQETMGGNDGEMAFTMPSEYSMEALPNPKDERVSLRHVPERTVAVIVFSGRASDAKAQTKWEELSNALAEAGVRTSGGPFLNQYNPPWTLPFLRRNEVMVEIDVGSLPAATTGNETKEQPLT